MGVKVRVVGEERPREERAEEVKKPALGRDDLFKSIINDLRSGVPTSTIMEKYGVSNSVVRVLGKLVRLGKFRTLGKVDSGYGMQVLIEHDGVLYYVVLSPKSGVYYTIKDYHDLARVKNPELRRKAEEFLRLGGLKITTKIKHEKVGEGVLEAKDSKKIAEKIREEREAMREALE